LLVSKLLASEVKIMLKATLLAVGIFLLFAAHQALYADFIHYLAALIQGDLTFKTVATVAGFAWAIVIILRTPHPKPAVMLVLGTLAGMGFVSYLETARAF
jgi:hypothetical protein